ncbi:hypothetical protein FACS189425_06720 [Clostridia bacterium]|nr:hypothetical protein FACS189425_06720 [Clostridia bacterium]
MDKATTIKTLVFFREIEREIKFCHKVIDKANAEHYTPGVTISYNALRVSGGEASSSTERIALDAPETVSETISRMEAKIANLAQAKREIWNALETLPPLQKRVIYRHYIDLAHWRTISIEEKYSERTCKRICKRGLDKLSPIFESCPAVSLFFCYNSIVKSYTGGDENVESTKPRAG